METEELKLGDRLALERTVMAANRTLLAWVRTSLSLISFGFTIYKFLQYMYAEGLGDVMRPESPRNLGLFLLTAGTVPLFLFIIEFVSSMKRLGKNNKEILLGPAFITASAVLLLGCFLALSIITKLRIF